jgi:hypothetical protein
MATLPGFIASYNARFGRQPANAKDLHRPLTAADNLEEIPISCSSRPQSSPHFADFGVA